MKLSIFSTCRAYLFFFKQDILYPLLYILKIAYLGRCIGDSELYTIPALHFQALLDEESGIFSGVLEGDVFEGDRPASSFIISKCHNNERTEKYEYG